MTGRTSLFAERAHAVADRALLVGELLVEQVVVRGGGGAVPVVIGSHQLCPYPQ